MKQQEQRQAQEAGQPTEGQGTCLGLFRVSLWVQARTATRELEVLWGITGQGWGWDGCPGSPAALASSVLTSGVTEMYPIFIPGPLKVIPHWTNP